MKSASFDYSRPHSVAEACGLLAAGEELAKPMAGGQSLGPMLNLRLAQPAAVIDLGAIEGLREAREEGDAVFLGAQVTHAAIEDRRVADPSQGLMPSVAANIRVDPSLNERSQRRSFPSEMAEKTTAPASGESAISCARFGDG